MASDVTGKGLRERAGLGASPALSSTALSLDHDNVVDQEEGDDLGGLHEEVLATLADAKSLDFLPIYNQDDNALLACCFLWDASGIRMANGNNDVHEYRVLGNFLSHNVAQIRMQTSDAEQNRFMANFSHDLISPIHGILGSVQFLARHSFGRLPERPVAVNCCVF